MKHDSNASSKTNVSAERVLLATRFSFSDFHAMGAYLLLQHKNIMKPSCNDPLLRLVNDASLKQ